ncbi:MAG: hypothetical protein LH618_09540, partial [Saprospiraceae bacterium]|nr:hypothetical protein [Saprospiraceae bacterium]
TDELRYVKDYRVHQFILPFTFNIYLNAKKSVFINTIFRPAFTFNKTAIDNLAEKRVSKWKFEYSSFEVLPGLGTQIGQHWWLNLNYRWYYIHKLDRVIFNSILNPPQSFIEKKYDTYNPFQIQLTVGYWIKKK